MFECVCVCVRHISHWGEAHTEMQHLSQFFSTMAIECDRIPRSSMTQGSTRVRLTNPNVTGRYPTFAESLSNPFFRWSAISVHEWILASASLQTAIRQIPANQPYCSRAQAQASTQAVYQCPTFPFYRDSNGGVAVATTTTTAAIVS